MSQQLSYFLVAVRFWLFRTMDNAYLSKQTGGSSNLSRLLLLLFLTGLQPGVASAGAEPELYGSGDRLKVVIVGLDYVTVGVPAAVVCEGTCLTCTYSMYLDGQTAQGQGNVLSFTVSTWVEAITVTCTATNDTTQESATATKHLQVLAGPANISITRSGPMDASMSYTYTCHACCRPSCTYAWKVDQDGWNGDHGKTISLTLKDMYMPKVLTCKAVNSVSKMFISATQKINLTSVSSEAKANGPDCNLSPHPAETSAVLLLAVVISAALVL